MTSLATSLSASISYLTSPARSTAHHVLVSALESAGTPNQLQAICEQELSRIQTTFKSGTIKEGQTSSLLIHLMYISNLSPFPLPSTSSDGPLAFALVPALNLAASAKKSDNRKIGYSFIQIHLNPSSEISLLLINSLLKPLKESTSSPSSQLVSTLNTIICHPLLSHLPKALEQSDLVSLLSKKNRPKKSKHKSSSNPGISNVLFDQDLEEDLESVALVSVVKEKDEVTRLVLRAIQTVSSTSHDSGLLLGKGLPKRILKLMSHEEESIVRASVRLWGDLIVAGVVNTSTNDDDQGFVIQPVFEVLDLRLNDLKADSGLKAGGVSDNRGRSVLTIRTTLAVLRKVLKFVSGDEGTLIMQACLKVLNQGEDAELRFLDDSIYLELYLLLSNFEPSLLAPYSAALVLPIRRALLKRTQPRDRLNSHWFALRSLNVLDKTVWETTISAAEEGEALMVGLDSADQGLRSMTLRVLFKLGGEELPKLHLNRLLDTFKVAGGSSTIKDKEYSVLRCLECVKVLCQNTKEGVERGKEMERLVTTVLEAAESDGNQDGPLLGSLKDILDFLESQSKETKVFFVTSLLDSLFSPATTPNKKQLPTTVTLLCVLVCEFAPEIEHMDWTQVSQALLDILKTSSTVSVQEQLIVTIAAVASLADLKFDSEVNFFVELTATARKPVSRKCGQFVLVAQSEEGFKGLNSLVSMWTLPAISIALEECAKKLKPSRSISLQRSSSPTLSPRQASNSELRYNAYPVPSVPAPIQTPLPPPPPRTPHYEVGSDSDDDNTVRGRQMTAGELSLLAGSGKLNGKNGPKER